jgi:hypothetical protein
MRMLMKDLNWSRVKLADGTIKTYWYAWRGGPRINAAPGDAGVLSLLQRGRRITPKEEC